MKLPNFLKGRRAEPEKLDGIEFLELIEHSALDDPMPLSVVRKQTLLNVIHAGFVFYDAAAHRWWLTPLGKRALDDRRSQRDER